MTGGDPAVVTAGVEVLAAALRAQGVATVEVDWRPPVAGTEAALTTVLLDPRRHAANALAVARMLQARSALVGVRRAAEALHLQRGQFLHAGPPITWERASGPLRGALVGATLLEGLAETPEAAERLLERGSLSWEP
ncbi:MAG: DUF1116 domain-containing protein, partial [Sciscionella sp.]